MNVFISWSGELSKELGNEINDWIQMLLQAVETFYSPDDIQKGEFWAGEIKDQLKKNSTGIICLTAENKSAPWILFEAGALSNGIGRVKVIPLLFELDPSELKGPLAMFNATVFNYDDFKKLIVNINQSLEKKVGENALDKLFEQLWPELEHSISRVLAEYKDKSPGKKVAIREERDLLEEILTLQREMNRVNSEDKVDATLQDDFVGSSLGELRRAIFSMDDLLQTKLSNDKSWSSGSYRRPKAIPAVLRRFQIGKAEWYAIFGLYNLRPVEMFTGVVSEDTFLIPANVSEGFLLEKKLEKSVRYDFQFEDKHGYKTTLEGISNLSDSNKFGRISMIISLLMSRQIPFDFILEILSTIHVEKARSLEKWRRQVMTYLIELENFRVKADMQ